jgi:hypothetical protein
MSAPVLNSNANSALISTLSSSDALVNPYEYSLEKMLPFGAVYTTEINPVQGANVSHAANSIIDFDLPKWGMLRNVVLKASLTTGAIVNANQSKLGFLNCINNIELLSASRRILNLTRSDIVCLYSDYPHSQQQAIAANMRVIGGFGGVNAIPIQQDDGGSSAPSHTEAAVDVDAINTGMAKLHCLSIPFSIFFNHKLNPNLLFQEPLRVRVHLGDCVIGALAIGTGSNIKYTNNVASVYNPVLSLDYFNMTREMEDKTIQENYSDGSLSVVAYDFHDENKVLSVDLNNNSKINQLTQSVGTNYLECEIKDVGVVSDIYFSLERNLEDSTESAATDSDGKQRDLKLWTDNRIPLPFYRYELITNGQVIHAKHFNEVAIWGRKGDGAYPYTIGSGADRMESTPFSFVGKIPLCLSDDKRYPCGGISLRELHNVRLRVYFNCDNFDTTEVSDPLSLTADSKSFGSSAKTKLSLRVMLKKYQILTTESASGRVITSVAN